VRRAFLLADIAMAVGTLLVVTYVASSSVAARQGPADPSGRWTFAYTPPATPSRFGGGATARGGDRGGGSGRAGAAGRAATAAARAGVPPAAVDAQLELTLGPGGTVTGTIDLNPGARGAPGGNPERPVEISDGRWRDGHLTFSVWHMDRYHNRLRFEGTLAGAVLNLTMSRDTSSGVETSQVSARRRQ
jgi:hypothetical protein